MDRKDIIIIILSLIIIALLAIGAYNQAREDQIIYHTVNITDTFSLDVPISDNVTKTQVSPHMHIVNDSQNGIEITSFNMGNESTFDLIEDGSQYLYTQESYRKDNNYIAFFSPENTNDNVIIVCKDNETMARMIESVNY